MDVLKDVLVGVGTTAIIGIVTSLIATMVKAGQFHTYGFAVGKWLSNIGTTRLGKATWEKIEDLFSTTILSFAMGVKDGADWDDQEVKNLLKTSNRDGNLPRTDGIEPPKTEKK